jgi:hypothetical protein
MNHLAARSDESGDRLFVIEFDLMDLSSHFFNQLLGYRRAAEKIGMTPYIMLPVTTPAMLAEQLGGHRVIAYDRASLNDSHYDIDLFAEGDVQLRSLWTAIETLGVSRTDTVLIASGRPIVIYSLGAWLARLAPEQRPAVFINFLSHDYLDLTTMTLGAGSWDYRFAARDLALRPGQERVHFMTGNQRLVGPLARLCLRRVFLMPMPKYYGEAIDLSADAATPATIYVHLNQRSGVMLQAVETVVRRVLDCRPDIRFRIKYCSNALPSGTEAVLSPDLAARGVILVPTEQSTDDYLQTLRQCQIILLPHPVTEYKAVTSGVFAEGAALGKVLVYPDKTWMADQVAAGRATGIAFGVQNVAEITAATMQAIDALPRLLSQARAGAAVFRAQNSCRRNIELMRALTAGAEDMEPRFPLDSRYVLDSTRCHLGQGWSAAEDPGVWTKAELCEMFLHCEPSPIGPLILRLRLTPMLDAGGRQGLTLAVNGEALGDWTFGQDGKNHSIWRHVTIPGHLVPDGKMVLHLRVENPVSPKQLGLSADERTLGVILHEIALDQAAIAQPGEQPAFATLRAPGSI